MTAPPSRTHRGTANRSPGGATVVQRVFDLRGLLDEARAAGLSVGLVPTMGALHQGHRSLVRRAATECDVVVVTIFVNPLQFAPEEDLATYPRDLDGDIDEVASGGGDIVFAPSVAEMYPDPDAASATVTPGPEGPSAPVSGVSGLTDVYEGSSRPGHFAGVAAAVARLFDATGPCRAYFGEKDWQQLLVVRRMVDVLSLPVDVVACPTVRDTDGLACSSRNARLSSDERRAALTLSRALAGAAALVDAGERDPVVVRRHLADAVAAGEPLVDLDYAAVVRAVDLAPLDRMAGEIRLLLAARVGGTRLIDNVGVTVRTDASRQVHRRSA